MAKKVPDFDGFLAILRKFGPIGRSRGMKIDLATIREQQQRHRGHRLGARPDIDQTVFAPLFCPRLVEMTAPQIDDKFAIESDRNRRANVPMFAEILLESRLYRRKARVAFTVNRGFH